MTWLQLLLIALVLALVAGLTVATLTGVRPARLRVPRFLRGVLFGPAGPAADYALTGDYFPLNFWSIYFPCYGTEEPPPVTAQHILGSGIRRAGRGL